MTRFVGVRRFVLLPSLLVLACGPTGSGASDAGPDRAAADAAACVDGGSGAWDTLPTRLDPATSQAADAPHVGFDAQGNAIAVWEQSDGTLYSVWASRRTPDGAWSQPEKISSTPEVPGSSVNLAPQLAVSSDGSAIAVWQQPAGTGLQNVWANHYAPGAGWAGETAIEQPEVPGGSGLVAGNAMVSMNAKGDAVVTWEENDGQVDSAAPDFTTQIYVNRWVGGAWAGAKRLSSFDVLFGAPNTNTQNAARPQVALDDAGQAVAAWEMFVQNTGGKVQAARLDPATSAWSGPVYLDTCTADCANQAIFPQVALDTAGDALVVYNLVNTGTGGTRGTYATRLAAGAGTWSSPQSLDPSLAGSADDHPALAVDHAGNAVAVWQTTRQSHGVYGAVLRGGTWSSAAPIDGAGDTTSGRPTVAVNDAGDATVLWDDQGAVYASTLAAGTFGAKATLFQGPSGGTDAQLAFAHGGCTRAVAVFWSSAGAFALVEH